MSLLVLFAFIGGVVTILSPCILPILPIVLSGSVGAGKKRPLGIVLGFIVSFTFFTLFLTSIVQATGVSPDILRNTSVVILIVFGIVLLLPQAQAKIEQLFSKIASRAPQQNVQRDGLGGGFIIGLSLGLLWTPCVGPILASVISLALTGTVTGSAFVITLAYSLGTAIPMLAIMYGGRQLLNRVPWLLNNAANIQKAFGVLMIIVAIAIVFNLDRSFQSYILEKFPRYGTGLTSLEDNDAIKQGLRELNSNNTDQMTGKPLSDLINEGVPAPELIVGGEWVQGEQTTLAALKGQVVLVDFMTYSCINCIRTFPYLNDWYDKYKDEGLVIIGVHTPEFEFEKDPDNVRKALQDFEIEFPVMQDNNFATWRAYDNHYWPRKYLIDHNGNIVYDHIGEGAYDETESMIQDLLEERNKSLGQAHVSDQPLSSVQGEVPQGSSPETYFGAWRNELLGNGERSTIGQQSFVLPETLFPNTLYLSGDWNITREYAENVSSDAKIYFVYNAKNVFMVAGSDEPVTMSLKQDDQPLGSAAGSDAVQRGSDAVVEFQQEELYRLIENSEPGIHIMELTIEQPGLQVFTFTFG